MVLPATSFLLDPDWGYIGKLLKSDSAGGKDLNVQVRFWHKWGGRSLILLGFVVAYSGFIKMFAEVSHQAAALAALVPLVYLTFLAPAK